MVTEVPWLKSVGEVRDVVELLSMLERILAPLERRARLHPGTVAAIAIGGFLLLYRVDLDFRQVVLKMLGVREPRAPRAGVAPGQRMLRAPMEWLQTFWQREQERGILYVFHAMGTTPGEVLHRVCQGWPEVGGAGEGARLLLWCAFCKMPVEGGARMAWACAFFNPFSGYIYPSGEFNGETEGSLGFPVHKFSTTQPCLKQGVVCFYHSKPAAMHAAYASYLSTDMSFGRPNIVKPPVYRLEPGELDQLPPSLAKDVRRRVTALAENMQLDWAEMTAVMTKVAAGDQNWV